MVVSWDMVGRRVLLGLGRCGMRKAEVFVILLSQIRARTDRRRVAWEEYIDWAFV